MGAGYEWKTKRKFLTVAAVFRFVLGCCCRGMNGRQSVKVPHGRCSLSFVLCGQRWESTCTWCWLRTSCFSAGEPRDSKTFCSSLAFVYEHCSRDLACSCLTLSATFPHYSSLACCLIQAWSRCDTSQLGLNASSAFVHCAQQFLQRLHIVRRVCT